MWADESVFYQIYPLGFCNAPKENDGATLPRIKKVEEWIPHILKLGCNAVYFSPVFSSDAHGYDTRDYRVIDCRLGTNEDFAEVCSELHKHGIRVVLDGVFNHVGRGFWAFRDVLEHREHSRYRDWFHINFSGNNAYNDGLWYEGWEGHFELVKLNLDNHEVREHLFTCVQKWVSDFDIDGLRLDVAYCLNRNFLHELRGYCNRLKPDFFLSVKCCMAIIISLLTTKCCTAARIMSAIRGFTPRLTAKTYLKSVIRSCGSSDRNNGRYIKAKICFVLSTITMLRALPVY